MRGLKTVRIIFPLQEQIADVDFFLKNRNNEKFNPNLVRRLKRRDGNITIGEFKLFPFVRVAANVAITCEEDVKELFSNKFLEGVSVKLIVKEEEISSLIIHTFKAFCLSASRLSFFTLYYRKKIGQYEGEGFNFPICHTYSVAYADRRIDITGKGINQPFIPELIPYVKRIPLKSVFLGIMSDRLFLEGFLSVKKAANLIYGGGALLSNTALSGVKHILIRRNANASDKISPLNLIVSILPDVQLIDGVFSSTGFMLKRHVQRLIASFPNVKVFKFYTGINPQYYRDALENHMRMGKIEGYDVVLPPEELVPLIKEQIEYVAEKYMKFHSGFEETRGELSISHPHVKLVEELVFGNPKELTLTKFGTPLEKLFRATSRLKRK